jgi:hypothetical protein
MEPGPISHLVKEDIEARLIPVIIDRELHTAY